MSEKKVTTVGQQERMLRPTLSLYKTLSAYVQYVLIQEKWNLTLKLTGNPACPGNPGVPCTVKQNTCLVDALVGALQIQIKFYVLHLFK